MVKAKPKRKNCPPGIPKQYFSKAKKELNWKAGSGGEAWQKVFLRAHELHSAWKKDKSPSQRKAAYNKACWTKTGKLKKQYYKRKDGVKKSKGKGKAKSKGGRKKIPVGHVGLGWIRENCSQATAKKLESEGKKSAGIKWIKENCLGNVHGKAESYLKSKKKAKARLGGCGCAACKAGIGGCACASGDGSCSIMGSRGMLY
jgi:hypothetical protein